MFKITGEIEFIADVLFHAFTADASDKLDRNQTGGKRSREQKEAEALTYLYKNESGELIIPRANFKKALLDGCGKANLKEGKKSLIPFVQATCFVDADLKLGKKSHDYIHMCSGRVPPRTGGRVVIRRPALRAGCKAKFSITCTDDRRNPDQIRQGLEEAGLLVGLADWRPEFGRFLVTAWEVHRDDKRKKSAA
jgi:hypothetical protein